MTCIVGWVEKDRVLMGGDRAGSNNSITHNVLHPKVFRKKQFVFGYTSSFRFGQLIEHTLDVGGVDPELDPHEFLVETLIPRLRQILKDAGYAKIENNEESGGSVLVAYKKRLFQIQDDFSVLEHQDGYDAVGSGSYFAIGSLYTSRQQGTPADQAVKLALQAAARHNPFVREPFDILEAP